MARARAIVIQGGQIALMERRRRGRLFYVFPGGGVEPTEQPADAARREVEEEIGLLVEIDRLVAIGDIAGEEQSFFLAHVIGGTLGPGTGEEYDADPEANGTYRPVWVPVDRVPALLLFPARVRELVAQATSAGWPEAPIAFVDGSWQERGPADDVRSPTLPS